MPKQPTTVFSNDARVRRVEEEFLARVLTRGLTCTVGRPARSRLCRTTHDLETLVNALDSGAFDPFIRQELRGVEAAPLQRFADVVRSTSTTGPSATASNCLSRARSSAAPGVDVLGRASCLV